MHTVGDISDVDAARAIPADEFDAAVRERTHLRGLPLGNRTSRHEDAFHAEQVAPAQQDLHQGRPDGPIAVDHHVHRANSLSMERPSIGTSALRMSNAMSPVTERLRA